MDDSLYPSTRTMLAEMSALIGPLRRDLEAALDRARKAEERVVDLELEVIKLRERISVLRGVSL